MIYGLFFCLFLVGIFLATEYVIALVPTSEAMIDKLEPYKGWLGLGLALTGLWWTLNFLILSDLNLLTALRGGPRIEILGQVITPPFKLRLMIWIGYFTSILPASLLTLSGGFLLGAEKIASLTGKGDQVDALKEKVSPYQRKIGVLSLAVAIWTLLIELAW